MSSSSSIRRIENITLTECIQVMIRILLRDQQRIISPLSNRLVNIDGPAITRILENCENRMPTELQELSTMVYQELRNEYAWSPFANDNFDDDILEGDFDERDAQIAYVINILHSHDIEPFLDILPDEIVEMLQNRSASRSRSSASRSRSSMDIDEHVTVRRGQRRGRDSRDEPPIISPNSASPPPRSNKSSSDITTETDIGILQQCKNLFNPYINSTIAPIFKRFANKLKKICNKELNRDRCTENELGTLLKTLRNKVTTRRANLEPINFLIAQSDELVKLYQIVTYKTTADMQKFFKTRNLKFNISYGGPEIDQGGVTRAFFSNVAKQIFSYKFFIPLDDEGKIYKINKDINVIFKPTLSRRRPPILSLNEKKFVFHFIGCVVAFLMLREIKLPGHFNKAILAHILYDEQIDPDEYVFYYSVDSDQARTVLDIMNTPANLEYLQFNDGYVPPTPSREGSDDVTVDSYRDYVRLRAKFILIGDSESEECLKSFIEGFGILSKSLRNKNVTLSQLDALLSAVKLTTDEIEMLKQKIQQNSVNDNDTEKTREFKGYFMNILDGTAPFPQAVANESAHLPQTRDEFLMRLLFFWSGNSNYVSTLRYTITATNSRHITAHTCWPYLEIPNRIQSREELYAELLRSCTSTDFGFA
jgi:hypothetical protein